MAAWHALEHDAADQAARIRARFEQGRDHVLATLRRDGSPRVSGTEVEFLDITEAVLTSVDEERRLLVIELWHEGRGYRRRERA